jgi:UPF0755 protein
MALNLKFLKALPFKVTTILNIFFGLCFVFILGYYLFSAPVNKSNYESLVIHISKTDTLNSVSTELKQKNIIRSEFFLKSFVFLFSIDRKINRGDYMFERNSPVFTISWQLAKGKHKVDKIKITLREGLTTEEMADTFSDKLINFRRDLFLEESYGKEGYLFPDTYFFFPMDEAEDIVSELNKNFGNQIKKIDPLIKSSKSNLEEIIKMASIIEKEANGEKDAHLISGILWKRLSIGMPLQVDASPITYKEKGLPESPICNPGMSSIKASLDPVSSTYLYYLHDKKGDIHFAKSYEEHQKNIREYLK